MSYYYIGDKKAIVSLRNGLFLTVPTQDPFIGCRIAIDRAEDPLIEQTIAAKVNKSSRCINVGANVGYYAIKLASLCFPEGQLFCFEPNPKNLDILVFNLCLNQFPSWAHVYRAAVSEKTGLAKFVVSPTFSDGWISTGEKSDEPQYDKHGLLMWEGLMYRTAETVEVPVVTLDGILGSAGAFDFLLCDAEGFDFHVVMGGANVIRNSPNMTMILEWNSECFHKHFSPGDLSRAFQLLDELGYLTSFSYGSEWQPFDFSKGGIPILQCNILCSKRNF
jgi:FkbM family methyltransferase